METFHESFQQTFTLRAENKICEACGHIFKRPADLVRHKRIHTGEKPFQCDNCKRSFRTKSALENHKATHFGTFGQFKCSMCLSNFLSRSALKLHFRKHTGETPFSCDFLECDQSFMTRKLLNSHIRRNHFNNNSALPDAQGISDIFLDDKTPNITDHHALGALDGVIMTASRISMMENVANFNFSENSSFEKFNCRQKAASKEFMGTYYPPLDGHDSNISQQNSSIFIRVLLRSGSVEFGNSIRNNSTNIIVELAVLENMKRDGYSLKVPLKNTGINIETLVLFIDTGALLKRIETTGGQFVFSVEPNTTIIQPSSTPFVILMTPEEAINKIRYHNFPPIFLIECRLINNDTSCLRTSNQNAGGSTVFQHMSSGNVAASHKNQTNPSSASNSLSCFPNFNTIPRIENWQQPTPINWSQPYNTGDFLPNPCDFANNKFVNSRCPYI